MKFLLLLLILASPARGADCAPGYVCTDHVELRFTEATGDFFADTEVMAGDVLAYQIQVCARAVYWNGEGPASDCSKWIAVEYIVPEPSPLAQLMSGVVALGAMARRRHVR